MDGWLDDVVGSAGSTVASYVLVLAVVRAAGRRTVSEMSAFDVVITIALGSLLAQTSTSEAGLIRGLVAISVLLVLQVTIAWIRDRFRGAKRWIDFEPRVVVLDGHIRKKELNGGLGGPRITEGELLAMLRQHGVRDVADVRIAVMEATGALSVLQRTSVVPNMWQPDGPAERSSRRGSAR